jgi:hypothetical protein
MSASFFIFLLQDDIMLPDRILHQYEAAKENTNAVSKATGYTFVIALQKCKGPGLLYDTKLSIGLSSLGHFTLPKYVMINQQVAEHSLCNRKIEFMNSAWNTFLGLVSLYASNTQHKAFAPYINNYF